MPLSQSATPEVKNAGEEPLSQSDTPEDKIGEEKQKKKKKKKELLNCSSTFLDPAAAQPSKEQRSKLGWDVECQFRSVEDFEASAIRNEIRYISFEI